MPVSCRRAAAVRVTVTQGRGILRRPEQWPPPFRVAGAAWGSGGLRASGGGHRDQRSVRRGVWGGGWGAPAGVTVCGGSGPMLSLRLHRRRRAVAVADGGG